MLPLNLSCREGRQRATDGAGRKPLFSQVESNILSGMDSKDQGESRPEVSPAEARESLNAVAEVAASTAWRPSGWVVALSAVVYGTAISAFVWHWFWMGFIVLAVFGLLALLFRRHLFNPHTRENTVTWLDQPNTASTKEKWVYGTFFIWVPTSILIPPEPRWIGALFGACAAVHLYYALKDYGATE